MAQFMLVLRDEPSRYRDYSPSDWQALIEKYNAWSGGLAAQGRLLAGKKLTDGSARVMSKRSGKLVVKDGPFGETKEVVGGFFIIKADDLDHAVELCRDHPQFVTDGIVEIREVDLMGQPEE